jgi:uncharacterized membrane protein YfcA
MNYQNKWYLFIHNWFMSITMLFGSFIAGATPEGGGAVAFPVMTLMFDIKPHIARNFSLAIQSFGMTAASFLIITQKIKIDKTYLCLCSFGGFFGIAFGSYFIAPLVSPPYAKMFFVSLWLSFGVALFYINFKQDGQIIDHLPQLSNYEKKQLMFLGFLGGVVVSIVGSGIDILTFSIVTIRYRLSEKVATPTSVCLMTGNTIIGFLIHVFLLRDFGVEEFNYLLVCIPVVIFFAPFGAYLINQKTRNFISNFLYTVLIAQFLGALIILKPTGFLAWFSLATFITGLIFFFSIRRLDY